MGECAKHIFNALDPENIQESCEYKQTALACGVCQCPRKLIQYHIIQRPGVLCRHVISIHGIEKVWCAGHDLQHFDSAYIGKSSSSQRNLFTVPIRNILPTQTNFGMWIATLGLILSYNFIVTSKLL